MQATATEVERYFMSQDEQDAAVGRFVRKYRDVSAKHAALVNEARTAGEILVELGTSLKSGTPQHTRITPEAIKFVNIENVQKLEQELRACALELKSLETQKSQFGL